ncbi:MAG: hypothetical protein GY765_25210 [bacterium]|nr:hypothetical protein [bacterium]
MKSIKESRSTNGFTFNRKFSTRFFPAICVIVFFACSSPGFGHPSMGKHWVWYHNSVHGEYKYHDECIPLLITKNGTIRFSGTEIEKLEELELKIQDFISERRCVKCTIALHIDRKVPYGKVVDVFRYLQSLKVKSVFIVTNPQATVLDWLDSFNIKNKQRRSSE